jgi:trk system potassium uptake protein TrkA
MKVIIVGCGRVGSDLAYRFYRRGHTVTVIDQVATAFESLPPDFQGHAFEGEVLNQEVLRRAGIKQADALATVTNSDAVNAVVAHVARTVFRVPRVVARNYDPSLRALLEAFGLQIVSSAAWGAQRIEELLAAPPLNSVFSAGNGEVELYEVLVPDGWSGRPLDELLRGVRCIPVALTRAGRADLAAGEDLLQGGDVLHLAATREGIDALRQRLAAGEDQ